MYCNTGYTTLYTSVMTTFDKNRNICSRTRSCSSCKPRHSRHQNCPKPTRVDTDRMQTDHLETDYCQCARFEAGLRFEPAAQMQAGSGLMLFAANAVEDGRPPALHGCPL